MTSNTIFDRDRAIAKGIKQCSIEDYQQAIFYFTKAIELDPSFAVAYYNRGNTYHKLDLFNEAIGDYSQALKLNPNDAAAYNTRGNLYYKLKQYKEAINDYSKALELNPKYIIVYCSRGNAYYELEEYEKAVADYAKAHPNDPATRINYEKALTALTVQKQFAENNQAMNLLTEFLTQNQSKSTSITLTSTQVIKSKLLPKERARLRVYLSNRFSFSELQIIAFDLDIDNQMPSNVSPSEYAQKLIAFCQRNEQLHDLLELALNQRPDPEIQQLL